MLGFMFVFLIIVIVVAIVSAGLVVTDAFGKLSKFN